YGGEPTLDPANMRESMAFLRAGGFRGWITLFTNGVLAERLIALLEADEQCEAVLNYSILHGRDAEPLPRAAYRRLADYARRPPAHDRRHVRAPPGEDPPAPVRGRHRGRLRLGAVGRRPSPPAPLALGAPASRRHPVRIARCRRDAGAPS